LFYSISVSLVGFDISETASPLRSPPPPPSSPAQQLFLSQYERRRSFRFFFKYPPFHLSPRPESEVTPPVVSFCRLICRGDVACRGTSCRRAHPPSSQCCAPSGVWSLHMPFSASKRLHSLRSDFPVDSGTADRQSNLGSALSLSLGGFFFSQSDPFPLLSFFCVTIATHTIPCLSFFSDPSVGER